MTKSLKILFATDFSPSARVALRNLMLIKDKFNTEISMVYVIVSFWRDWVASGTFQKEALQRLERWQLELGEGGAKQAIVQHGNPADAILSQASQIKPDLIVMGAKEAQLKGRYRSGSTVESVVRKLQILPKIISRFARHRQNTFWAITNHGPQNNSQYQSD